MDCSYLKWIILIQCWSPFQASPGVWSGVAAAEDEGGEVEWPRCPPPPARCRLDADDANHHTRFAVYKVDGGNVHISIPLSEQSLTIDCKNKTRLDSESMPRFRNRVNFINIIVVNCNVPEKSYEYSITASNMILSQELEIKFEYHVNLSKKLEKLPTKKLKITGIGDSILYLDDRTFDGLPHMEELTLVNVYTSVPSFAIIDKIEIRNGKVRGKWHDCNHRRLSLESVEFVDYANQSSELEYKKAFYSSNLTEMTLKNMSAIEITQGIFVHFNLSSLRQLTIADSSFKNITRSTFNNLTKLEYLTLSNNSLKELPSGIFTKLPSLKNLYLDKNPLGDICTENGSVLGNIQNLKVLSLNETGAVRICGNWKTQLPRLTQIYLLGNNITKITFKDMQELQVDIIDVRSNPIEAVYYTKEDYDYIMTDYIPYKHEGDDDEEFQKFRDSYPAVYFDALQKCDCRTYWFALAWHHCPEHINLKGLPQCSQGDQLFSSSYSGEWCGLPAGECAAGCACRRRAGGGGGGGVAAACGGAALRALPRVRGLTELHAADNRITHIDAAALTDSLTYLDLEHNQITRLDAETTKELFKAGRRVRLAGNPLLCACDDYHLIQALKSHSQQVVDLENVTCSSGQALSSVSLSELCGGGSGGRLPTALAAAAGALAALLLLLGALYLRCERRLKLYLFAKGCCLRCVRDDEADRGKTYDAYVAYCRRDERFVYEKIVRVLESDKYGFRLCVCSRDWTVGEWIPTLITDSVDRSRRTLIVLSENFVTSTWGRLEFQTAYLEAVKERRARIVIVLLQDISRVKDQLDAELRSYLDANSYITWGDPMFYQKLCYALPHRKEERIIYDAEKVLKYSIPFGKNKL